MLTIMPGTRHAYDCENHGQDVPIFTAASDYWDVGPFCMVCIGELFIRQLPILRSRQIPIVPVTVPCSSSKEE